MSQPHPRFFLWLGLLLCCVLWFPRLLEAAPPHPKHTTTKQAAPSSRPTTQVATSKPTSRPKHSFQLDPAVFHRPLRKDLKLSDLPSPFSLPIRPSHLTYVRAFAVAESIELSKEDLALLAFLEQESLREWKEQAMQKKEVRLRLIRHLRLHGLAKYRLLGFLRLKKMEGALARFLKQGGSLVARPEQGTPIYKAAFAFAKHAGNYPSLFLRIGLSSKSKSLSPEQRYWMRTLFMARWATQVMGIYSLPVLMGGPIYADYTRARFLFSNSSQRRMWAARELFRIAPETDSAKMIVWAWVREGKPLIALRYLRHALRKAPSYKSAYELLLLITRKP